MLSPAALEKEQELSAATPEQMTLPVAPGTDQEPSHLGNGICYDAHGTRNKARTIAHWVRADAVDRGPRDGTLAVTRSIRADAIACV